MNKQQRLKEGLIPSMNSANYSKSKNMSVGTVCIKRFKFACMTILSPETVSLVLCQSSTDADVQVPPVPNQPKNAEILAQNALKMQKEATIYQKYSQERPPTPNPLTRVVIPPLAPPPSPLVLPMSLQFLVYQSLAATTEDKLCYKICFR